MDFVKIQGKKYTIRYGGRGVIVNDVAVCMFSEVVDNDLWKSNETEYKRVLKLAYDEVIRRARKELKKK